MTTFLKNLFSGRINRIQFLIGTFVLGGLVFGMFFFDGGGLPIVTEKNDKPIVTFKEKSIEAEFYRVSARYPEVQALKDADVQERVNKDIENFITSRLPTQEQLNDDSASIPEICYSERPPASCEATLDIYGQVALITPNYLSVSYGFYTYGHLAAHPLHYVSTFTYNLETGENLSLEDFFKHNSDYLAILSEKLKSDLRGKLGKYVASEQFDEGTSAKEENFSDFILTDEGFVFLFEDYSIAPYAAGNFESMVPYTELLGILQPYFASKTKMFEQYSDDGVS